MSAAEVWDFNDYAEQTGEQAAAERLLAKGWLLMPGFTEKDYDGWSFETLDQRDERRKRVILRDLELEHEGRHWLYRHPFCQACRSVWTGSGQLTDEGVDPTGVVHSRAAASLTRWLILNPGRTPRDTWDGTVPEDVDAGEVGTGGLDWSTFFDDDDAEPVWIAGQLAEHGQQIALVGSGKVGKSLLCLEWAVAIATGRSFLDDEPRQPLSVLYVDKENPQRDVRRRFRALGLDDLDDLSRLHYLSFPAHGPLDTAAGAAALLADVRTSGARVVFLDTASRMIEGKEDASDTWLARYRLTLMSLKAMGVAVIRLDHFGKDPERGARGSSAKTQDVDQVWELTASTKTALRLKRTHSRTGLGEDDLRLTCTGEPGEVGTTRQVRSLSLGTGGSNDPGVLNAVLQLAEAGCPAGLSRRALAAWSKDQGVGIALSNETWGEVVRERDR